MNEGQLSAGEVDRSRLVEVVVPLADGSHTRASGLLVSGAAVLTAWHAVAGSAAIRLIVGAPTGEPRIVQGGVPVQLGESDVALVPTVEPIIGTPNVPLGRFTAGRVAIDGSVAGFPRWKLRRFDGLEAGSGDRAPKFRDALVEAVRLCPEANPRGGGLTVLVKAPAPDPEGPSPWEGLSGAPVFCQGAVVGVITHHHRREGLGRLAAVRLDRCLAALTADEQARVAELLGTGVPVHLRDIGVSSGRLLGSAYRELVRDIAPQALRDREPELDRLAAFCVGDEPYLVIRAPAGAGKTGLMSTFALDPPSGAVVVPFFVTSRLAGQSDSNAFTDALLDQLAGLLDEELPPTASSSGRDAIRRRMLHEAARRVHAGGGRLVLVIDGLDEDAGTAPGSGLSSIAALLPRQCNDGMKVIVAGRPDPPLPADLRVRPDHPLCTAQPWLLDASPHAQGALASAEQELDSLLAGPALHVDLVGYVSASGGGLGTADLAALCGAPEHRIRHLVQGPAGRTIAARAEPYEGEHGLLFTHETLRLTAGRLLGAASLGTWRQSLHAWADQWRRAGWPASTPKYLLVGYPKMVEAGSDTTRLAALAVDTTRHDRLLDHTGGDHAALTEIAAAIRLVARDSPNDLATLIRLSRRRESLARRNDWIPLVLPVAWARLGRTSRAEHMARSISNPGRQVAAYASVAGVIVHTDPKRAAQLVDDAEQIARAVTEPELRADALTSIVRALAADDPDRAEQLAVGIADLARRDDALMSFVRGVAATDPVRAERTAFTINDPYRRVIALASALWGGAGNAPQRAEGLATEAENVGWSIAGNNFDRPDALAAVAEILKHLDAGSAAAIVQRIADVAQREEKGSAVARLLAHHDPVRALDIARRLRSGAGRGAALAAVAEVIAFRDPDLAEQVADEAVEILRGSVPMPSAQERTAAAADRIMPRNAKGHLNSSTPSHQRATWKANEPDGHVLRNAWAAIAAAVARADPDRAERLISRITSSYRRADAWTSIVRLIAETDPDRAERLARGIVNLYQQANALGAVAEAIVATEPARAELLVQSVSIAGQRVNLLLLLAMKLADIDAVRAESLAVEAERVARSLITSTRELKGLAEVAAALAGSDPDRAEQLVRHIEDPIEQAQVLAAVAAAVAGTVPDRAERLVRRITSLRKGTSGVVTVIAAMATADPGRAEQLALRIDDTAERVKALTAVGNAVHSIDRDRASGLFGRAVAELAKIKGRTQYHETLAALAPGLAAIDPDRLERLAADTRDSSTQAKVLAACAAALAVTDPHRAQRLAEHASGIADKMTNDERRAAVQGGIAASLARTHQDHAARTADKAERAALDIVNPLVRSNALAAIAKKVASTDPERARRLAKRVLNPDQQAAILVEIAQSGSQGAAVFAEAILISDVWPQALGWLGHEELAAIADEFSEEARTSGVGQASESPGTSHSSPRRQQN